jgi:hypothetical protein
MAVLAYFLVREKRKIKKVPENGNAIQEQRQDMYGEDKIGMYRPPEPVQELPGGELNPLSTCPTGRIRRASEPFAHNLPPSIPTRGNPKHTDPNIHQISILDRH